MLPDNETFRAATASLGILTDDVPVVVYDSHGIFSSCRAWWMLHSFGHRPTYILDGGLGKWEAEGRKLVSGALQVVEEENYQARSGAASPKIDLFGDANQKDQRFSV